MNRGVKRKAKQLTLEPVIVPAVLSGRERWAMRLLWRAGMLRYREAHGFDPLELRLGLRAQLRDMRPFYAKVNPLHHEILNRCPELDDSLPSKAWLHSVYFGNRRECVTLPGVLAVLKKRRAVAEAAYRASFTPLPAAVHASQPDLFGIPA